MDILLICGYFEECNQSEIVSKTITAVENAANTFQKRLISGIQYTNNRFTVVSAPFVGAWPTAYKDISFHGFKDSRSSKTDVRYVHFCNVWGYRNISRARAIKRAIHDFMAVSSDTEKAVIVYSPHTPFLEGAVYAKKLNPKTHICMVIPDLPQYMNLSKKNHPIYSFFKKIDIAKLLRLNQSVDSYMLLTKHMAEPMQVGNRPYIIIEGIANSYSVDVRATHEKRIVAYAGKLSETFGVKNLIEAFELIKSPNLILDICGGGDLRAYVESMSHKDCRIHYHGMVSAEDAERILRNADVLVNPRQNDNDYTKYSFPSKNIEYLMTSNTVVAYMLEGIPEYYQRMFIVPKGDSKENLAEAIMNALNENHGKQNERYLIALDYIKTHLMQNKVADKLVGLIQNCIDHSASKS